MKECMWKRDEMRFREICVVFHLAQSWQAFISILLVGTEMCSSTKIGSIDCDSVE